MPEALDSVPARVVRVAALAVAFLVAIMALLPGESVDSARTRVAAEPPFEVVHQLGGLIEAFVADGDRLYIGIGSRLVVLNADTDTGVPEGGTQYIALPHTIQDAAVLARNRVAVLAGNVVFFVDVSEPNAMAIEGTYDHGVGLGGIESWGGSVFLLGDDDMFVVDASDPAAAMHVGTLRLPEAFGVRSHMMAGDGVVFLGHGRAGVVVVDVSDPGDPRMIGGIEEDIVVHHMAVTGRRLYVHDGDDRFDGSGNRIVGVYVHVLDVEPGGSLVYHGLVTLIEPVPVPPPFHLTDIVAFGDHLYLSGSEADWDTYVWERQLRCWDMSDSSAPVELPHAAYPGLGSTVAIAASSGRVFVASNDATLLPDYRYQSPGVGVVDTSDPSAIDWKGYWQLDDLGRVSFLGATTSSVAIQEGYSPLIHTFPGVYEAGKPRAGYIYTGLGAANLRATHDRVYTIGMGDLVVYDITDLTQPELMATAPVTTRRTSLAIDEPHVYSQVGCSGASFPGREWYCTLVTLELVEDGDETRWHELAQVPVGHDVRDIAVGEGYAYVAHRRDGEWVEHLALYDVRDPRLPQYVDNIALGERVLPKRTVVRDGLAYVATRTLTEEQKPVATGMTVLDVADAPAVSVLGSVDVPSDVEQSSQRKDRNGHLALSGNYALFSSDEPLVHVVDVSDPTTPVEVQRVDVPAVVTDLDAAAGQVYVVSADGGMMVLRATGADQPPVHREWTVHLPFAVGCLER